MREPTGGAERAPSDPPFSVADVERAAARIAGRIHRTPVVTSRLLDRELGCQVAAKAEHLQRVGAFKARGAFNALLALDPDRRAAGVLAVSSGNHGQAVALAAAETGGRAVVVMPAGSNPAKVAATRAYGAEVIMDGVTGENRERFAAELAAARGLRLVHPFDDRDVMAGQGTAALELLEGEPGLDLVLVPVGGGGLIAGTAAAVKGRSPTTRVAGAAGSGIRRPARSDAWASACGRSRSSAAWSTTSSPPPTPSCSTPWPCAGPGPSSWSSRRPPFPWPPSRPAPPAGGGSGSSSPAATSTPPP